MKQRLPDLNALLPNFGWVGKDRIRDTLAKTTQHYKADQRVPMPKHFCSQFPGANVRRLPEWFSMDTFIAEEPAHDDGILGMEDVPLPKCTADWILNSFLVTPCPLNLPFPPCYRTSSVSMGPWKASNPIMRSPRPPTL